MWSVLLCALFLGVIYPARIEGRNPGLKFRVTQAGFNYAAQETVDVLSANIKEEPIQDYSGKAKTNVGKVEYGITNIRITSFVKPSSNLVVNPGSGIHWMTVGTSISMSADWRYKYKLMFISARDHGRADISVSGVNFQISVSLGMDGTTGRPTISASDCDCDIGSVHVKFHGGASWLYDIFDEQIEHLIKKNLQKLVCKATLKAINVNAARTLSKLKVKIPIEHMVELDYTVVAPPEFRSNYMESSHKGEVYWLNDPEEAPFTPTALPSSDTRDKMIYFWLSDYVINTMGYVLHKHGALNYVLTAQDLNIHAKDALNTTCPGSLCIGSMLHTVGELYPNSRMSLHMSSTQPPRMSIQPGQINGIFSGNIAYHIQLPNGTDVYAFTTKASFSLEMVAAIKNHDFISAHITKIEPKLKLVDSAISGISKELLNWVFQMVAKPFILPQLNKLGAMGLKIPNVDDVHFINPELSMQQGAILIGTDLKYVEPPTPVDM